MPLCYRFANVSYTDPSSLTDPAVSLYADDSGFATEATGRLYVRQGPTTRVAGAVPLDSSGNPPPDVAPGVLSHLRFRKGSVTYAVLRASIKQTITLDADTASPEPSSETLPSNAYPHGVIVTPTLYAGAQSGMSSAGAGGGANSRWFNWGLVYESASGGGGGAAGFRSPQVRTSYLIPYYPSPSTVISWRGKTMAVEAGSGGAAVTGGSGGSGDFSDGSAARGGNGSDAGLALSGSASRFSVDGSSVLVATPSFTAGSLSQSGGTGGYDSNGKTSRGGNGGKGIRRDNVANGSHGNEYNTVYFGGQGAEYNTKQFGDKGGYGGRANTGSYFSPSWTSPDDGGRGQDSDAGQAGSARVVVVFWVSGAY